MEECCKIDQEVGGKLKCAGDVVHCLVCIVTHDKRIFSQWLEAGTAPFLQACNTCELEMVVVHNEH